MSKELQYKAGREASFSDLHEEIITHTEQHGVRPDSVRVDIETLYRLKRCKEFLVSAYSVKSGTNVAPGDGSEVHIFGVKIIIERDKWR